jgi:Tol biopolymer transport system component
VFLTCVLSLAGCADGDFRGAGEGTAATQDSSSSAPPSQSATASALPGRLLFSRFNELSHTFLSTHTSRPDGTDEVDVAMPGPEGGGRWSRSGARIAVMTVLADERIGTAVITADGTVERVLAIPDASLNLVCTVWSPDDSRLACEAWDESDPSRAGIYSVSASDGADLIRLTTPPPDTFDLPGDYSPDGTRVLFKRATGGAEAAGVLMAVGVTGGDPQLVSDTPVEDPGRYSPDGTIILTSDGAHLLLIGTAGDLVSEIAEDGADLFGAVWSPDGSHIAFSRGASGPFADLYTSLPDGTDRRQVTRTTENEIRVEWGGA